MKLPLTKEYQAKYMVLVAWVSDKTDLTEEQVDEIVNDSYNKNLRQDLEDYCDALFDGEEMEE